MFQLREIYADCPKASAEYQVEGKRYVVVRHFTEETELAKVISDIARRRADREISP